MANKFKELPKVQEVKEVKEVKETPAASASPAAKPKRGGLSRLLGMMFSGSFLGDEKVIKNIPFVLYCSALIMMYIYYGYTFDRKIRLVNKLSSELKELRSEYISSKSDLMFVSKQSEVAKSVEHIGLKEPLVPPVKIKLANSTNQ